ILVEQVYDDEKGVRNLPVVDGSRLDVERDRCARGCEFALENGEHRPQVKELPGVCSRWLGCRRLLSRRLLSRRLLSRRLLSRRLLSRRLLSRRLLSRRLLSRRLLSRWLLGALLALCTVCLLGTCLVGARLGSRCQWHHLNEPHQ